MKKLKAVITVMLLVFTTYSFSQDKTAEEKALEITKNMKEQINFSDDKEAKVNAINLDFINQTEKIKTEEISKISKFKSLKKADEERDIKLKEILSKEEYELFKDNKSKNRKKIKDKIKESRN